MIHTAVVEDDLLHQRTLVGYLRDFFADRMPLDCVTYDDGADFLAHPPAQLDLVFLDIVMARSNGIDVAHRLRENNPGVLIVFVTEAVQYALEGYGVHAIDFLIKPLYYTSFCSTMQRALTVMHRRASAMVRVSFDKTTSYLDATSILYVETRTKGTLIHAQSGDYRCADTLRDLEEKLGPLGFGRCHQAYLVNVGRVESVRKTDVLVGGTWLPLSRHRRERFVEQLLREVGATA